MDIPLGQLRALEAVARHASFSRAAAELHLTQPAVSMQIRQLETRLGLPLLERVGKRAFLTRAGEVLLRHATRAFHEIETGVEMVQQLRGVVAGRVRLGTSASISIYLLPGVLRRFRARYPNVELIVVTGNATEIGRDIARNELDLGVASLPLRDRELTVLPLYRDELVAIAPGRSRAPRRRRRITAAELAREPLILFEPGSNVRRIIDGWFHRARVLPRLAMELGNTEAIKKLVGAGLGWSVTSSFSVKAEGASGELSVARLDPPLYRQIALVRRRDKPLTPALEALIGTLTTLARGRSNGRAP